MQDKVFFETGVENEDFEESLMVYMRTDPAIQREMQAYMVKMQMEAQKQMMGKWAHQTSTTLCLLSHTAINSTEPANANFGN